MEDFSSRLIYKACFESSILILSVYDAFFPQAISSCFYFRLDGIHESFVAKRIIVRNTYHQYWL